MPPEIDLDADASDAPSKTDASRTNSPIDYEGKYNGLNKKVTKQQQEITDLRAKLESASEDTESELADTRALLIAADKARKKAEKAHADLLTATAEAQAEAALVKLAAKYPNLKTLLEEGDLKEATSFKTPEDYDKYLARMNKLASVPEDEEEPEVADEAIEEDDEEIAPPPPKKRDLRGVVPPTSTRVVTPKKKTRSAQVISDEMMLLDPDHRPDHQKRYDALMDELISTEATLPVPMRDRLR